VGWLRIAVGILMIPLFISSLLKLEFFGAFSSLGIGFLIFQPWMMEQGWFGDSDYATRVSFWLVALVVILLSIGFETIFHSVKRKRKLGIHRDFGWKTNRETWNGSPGVSFGASEERSDENHVEVNVSFGSKTKYVHSQSLQTLDLNCSFGAIEIFLSDAQLHPDGACCDLRVNCGSIEMYIPRAWKVVNQTDVTLGAVEEKPHREDENSPTLTLIGSVQLGSLEIKYV